MSGSCKDLAECSWRGGVASQRSDGSYFGAPCPWFWRNALSLLRPRTKEIPMRSVRLAFAASVLASLILTCGVRAQTAAGTAFTFQGRLDNSSLPANGTFDLQFNLFGMPAGGIPLAPTICLDNVVVTGGLVTTTLDFGALYPGAARWVEVSGGRTRRWATVRVGRTRRSRLASS